LFMFSDDDNLLSYADEPSRSYFDLMILKSSTNWNGSV